MALSSPPTTSTATAGVPRVLDDVGLDRKERRAFQEVADAAHAAGWAHGSDLALTVAQMIAIAASDSPDMADARSTLLDPDTELTKDLWCRALDRAPSLDPRLEPFLTAGHGRDTFPSGLLEQIRQPLVAARILQADRPASSVIIQGVFGLLDSRRGPVSQMSREAQLLVMDALEIGADDRVYCANFGAACIALRLAVERRAYVWLEVLNDEEARLCGWLSAAADVNIDVVVRSPQQHLDLVVSDLEADVITQPEFDIAIVNPPFGWSGHRQALESRLEQTGLPPGSSPESLHVITAATRARRAVCFVPAGYLFRTTKAEQLLKEKAIVQHGLDAVVALPRTALGSSSTISTAALFFRSPAHQQHEGTVLMVDARGGAQASDDWHIAATELLRRRQESPFSAFATMHDIANQSFNFSVERYVLDPDARQAQQALAAARARLEDIAELHRPQSLAARKDAQDVESKASRSLLTDEGERLLEVGVSDLDEAGIVRQPRKVVPPTPTVMQRLRSARLEAGDVLIVNKGSVGRVGFVRQIPTGEAWLASQSFVVARLRPGGPISDPLVLFRFLASDVGQAAIRSLTVGATIPSLPMADIRKLPVLTPPEENQEEVSAEVREFFRAHDRIAAMREEAEARFHAAWPAGDAA